MFLLCLSKLNLLRVVKGQSSQSYVSSDFPGLFLFSIANDDNSGCLASTVNIIDSCYFYTLVN